MAISDGLTGLLLCVGCGGALEHLADTSGFFCPACRLKYPITEGIPFLVADKAEKIND